MQTPHHHRLISTSDIVDIVYPSFGSDIRHITPPRRSEPPVAANAELPLHPSGRDSG
jgi:hypothetical protein